MKRCMSKIFTIKNKTDKKHVQVI